jgi:translocator protein
MKLIISILIPLLVGFTSSFFTMDGVKGWYVTASKPSFNPPNWVFAPVWTTLYVLMGIAFYLVWKAVVDAKVKKTAITFYVIQLTLNFFWSLIFFRFQLTGWALVEIVFMWLFILLTIIWFGKINKTAAWLLVPYILWVSFATFLNYSIWQLN